MIDLGKLEPIGRKQWAKRMWDEYTNSRVAKAIERSNREYDDPTNALFDDVLNKAKWKATVDKKVNYLLARKPLCDGYQDELDDLSKLLKESAKKFYLNGSLIWIVQGDGESLYPKPMIMEDTIAVYGDEHKEQVVAFVRKYVDIELEPSTGAEQKVEYYELYYKAGEEHRRDTFCFSQDERDKTEILDSPLFLEIGKTGDAPLFAYVEEFIKSFDNLMKHQDATTEKNTDPLIEVRGYQGSSVEELKDAVEHWHLAQTDGTGGVTVHTLPMDSNSMEMWAKRLLQEYYEATCTVGKENELAYAQSGKAMDRLFVDMENDARDLASLLEEALKEFFEYAYGAEVDIVWNTDRPVDDAAIISAIAQSRGLVSDRTLLEQHPWVEDVEQEIERLAEQDVMGMEDLVEPTEEEEVEVQ